MSQSLRKSQFVITFGPGAILEGRNGPRMIPRPDFGVFNPRTQIHPSNFELRDQRMTQGLLGSNTRIFRLPSNAELQIPEMRAIYQTRQFPDWRLCINNHTGGFSVLYHGRGSCPQCHGIGRTQEPVRFVRACRAGHLDDVDWNFVAHRNSNAQCQGSPWIKWLGGGGSLSQVIIECPRCQASHKLGEAYMLQWPCSGRFPEREPVMSSPIRQECHENSKIIQRQASNLRVPELKTLFTIPPRNTDLHRLLENPQIYSILMATKGQFTRSQLEGFLSNLVSGGLVTEGSVRAILAAPPDELLQAIQDVLTPISTEYDDLILEEFRALIQGSIDGVPAVHAQPPSSHVIFEIDPRLVVRYPGPKGTMFRIVPVLSLRTVTVQVGYRREVDTENPAETVPVCFHDPLNPIQEWYPGVEFLGEGIFIMLDANEGISPVMSSQACKRWAENQAHQNKFPQYVFRSKTSKSELDPYFVWWHTLSHLIIRSVSIKSGYSTAAIRERVYTETGSHSTRGGILLYATQPGSEGSLGGLIATVPSFDSILRESFESLERCSGDPLCIENKVTTGAFNGSACYSCTLISETSCETRNMWLDRNVLIENMP